jgi:hypothetical protein
MTGGRWLLSLSQWFIAIGYLDGGSGDSGTDVGAMWFCCGVEVVTGGAGVDDGGVICELDGGLGSSIWIY